MKYLLPEKLLLEMIKYVEYAEPEIDVLGHERTLEDMLADKAMPDFYYTLLDAKNRAAECKKAVNNAMTIGTGVIKTMPDGHNPPFICVDPKDIYFNPEGNIK